MFSEEKTPHESHSSFLAFVGGFIGAMTHYITSMRILLAINFNELFDFTVHSLIGGAVMYVLKLAGDGIVYLVKKGSELYKKKKQQSKQNQIQPSAPEVITPEANNLTEKKEHE